MRTRIVAALAAAALASSAIAADRIRVGFISTLSGPSAALGVDIRDGFQLAVKLNGGRLGGLPAEVLIADDQFKPDVGRQAAQKMVQLDKVHFMTGIVFSNIMLASVPLAFDNKTIYVCPASIRSPGVARLPLTRRAPVRAQRETMLKLTSGECRLNQRSRRMPSSSSATVKLRGSAMRGRLAPQTPIVERLPLKLVDQPPRLGAFPLAGEPVLLRALHPPALPR